MCSGGCWAIVVTLIYPSRERSQHRTPFAILRLILGHEYAVRFACGSDGHSWKIPRASRFVGTMKGVVTRSFHHSMLRDTISSFPAHDAILIVFGGGLPLGSSPKQGRASVTDVGEIARKVTRKVARKASEDPWMLERETPQFSALPHICSGTNRRDGFPSLNATYLESMK